MGEQQHSAMWMFLKNFSNKFSMPDFVNGNNEKRGPQRKHISYDRIGTHDKGDFLSSSNPHLLDIVRGKEEDHGESGGGESCNSNTSSPYHPTCSNGNANNHAKKCLTSSQTTPSISTKTSPKPPPPKPAQTTSSTTTTSRFSSLFKGGRSVDFNLKTKKFVFPNKVPSYWEEEDDKHHLDKAKITTTATTNIIENVEDAKWLGIDGGGRKTGGSDEGESDDDDDDDFNNGKDYNGGSSCTSDYEDEDDDDEEIKGGTRCGICGCEKKYEQVVVNNGGGGGGGGFVRYN